MQVYMYMCIYTFVNHEMILSVIVIEEIANYNDGGYHFKNIVSQFVSHDDIERIGRVGGSP